VEGQAIVSRSCESGNQEQCLVGSRFFSPEVGNASDRYLRCSRALMQMVEDREACSHVVLVYMEKHVVGGI